MAVAMRERISTDYYNGFKNLLTQHRCKRRIFVQTDSGRVMGIELEKTDNVHSVKKKMLMALNLPIEATALTFGDMVLKNNDLRAVRNDAALRLTKADLQRSSSTPFFLADPEGRVPRDKSRVLEILVGINFNSRTEKLMAEAVKSAECGMDLVPVKGGLGGVYFLRNTRGENIGVVKPIDEEPLAPNNPKGFVGKALGQPGLKRSVRVGETGGREVAAYLLDHENFAKVPPTVLIKISHSVFHVNGKAPADNHRKKQQEIISKIASFQQFVPHDYDAGDHSPSSFSVESVHRIGILDVRILNTDRHTGNILVKKSMKVGEADELIPIDHGLSLPETLDDPYFEWLHWPQASVDFSDYELEYISRLDPVRDSELLRSEIPMLRDSSLRIFTLCTILLKRAATYGLVLAEIGEIMSRGYNGVEMELSQLEMICRQAKAELDQQRFILDTDKIFDLNGFDDYYANQLQLDLNKNGQISCLYLEDVNSRKEPSNTACRCSSPRTVIEFPQSKEEEAEEETVAPEKQFSEESLVIHASTRSVSFSDGNQIFPSRIRMQKGFGRQWISGQVAMRNRQQLDCGFLAANCYDYLESSDEEWCLFLECFEGLLSKLFEGRKNMRFDRLEGESLEEQNPSRTLTGSI